MELKYVKSPQEFSNDISGKFSDDHFAYKQVVENKSNIHLVV